MTGKDAYQNDMKHHNTNKRNKRKSTDEITSIDNLEDKNKVILDSIDAQKTHNKRIKADSSDSQRYV